MAINDRIKTLRVDRGWSQEQMAEKLAVSRQAVTKWETGAGTPDIENLKSIAQLFGVTTDELVFGDAAEGNTVDSERFESVTSLDLAAERHYDIKVGSARKVALRGASGEKLVVRLASDEVADLERAFKVVLDTEGRNLDIDVTSTGVVADSVARRSVDVLIELPAAYSEDAELEMNADELLVADAHIDLEVGGKVDRVRLADVEGHFELDVSTDMEIWADGVTGRIDVNQVGAVSTLHVAHDAPFTARAKGRLGKRTLRFTRDGEAADAPTIEEASLSIELAGARCELTIDSVS